MPSAHTSTAHPEHAAPSGDRLPVLKLVVLAAALFAAVVTEVMPVGLLPQLADGFDVSQQRIGWWVSAYAFVVALTAIPLTAVLARWPRRPVLLLLLATYAASNAVILVAPTYWVGLAGRVLGGVAHAGIFSVVVATAASLAPPGKAGRAVALVNVGVAPALAFGLPAATAAGTAWGWRWPFAAATLVLVVLAVATARIIPATRTASEPLRVETRRSSGVLSALRSRGLQRVGLTTVVLTVGHYSAYTYVTPLVLRSGVGQDVLSLVLLGYGAAGFLGLLLAAAFSDRYPMASLRLAIIGTAVSLLALTVVTGSSAGTVGAVLVWGAAFSAVPTLLNTAALRVSAVPDAAPAVVNAMFNVGIATGAWVGGRVLETGGTTMVAIAGAVVVALSLPLVARRSSHHGEGSVPSRAVALVDM